MRTFVYKIEDITKRSDSNRRMRITAMRVHPTDSDKCKHASREYQYESEFQAFLELAKQHKWLPSKAFATRESTSGYVYCTAWLMERAKIARVLSI